MTPETRRRHYSGPDRPPSRREALWIAAVTVAAITLAVLLKTAS